MALRSRALLGLVSICSATVMMPVVAAAQRITVDGRFSPAQTLIGPNYAIPANLGKQFGGNLFHSFGQFGLATGENASFSGPATVNNVIGRVTGGNTSAIDGKIQSTIAGANLYLINPSGIVFGPNATVNVSGSFHASTADYVRMSDGAKFQATNPDASTFSAAPPAAFGFLTANPANVSVNGSSLAPGPAPVGSPPATLGLVGGPISIIGATLSAPAGTLHVTSTAGIGEIAVDPRNAASSTVTGFGPVDIKSGSMLNVSDKTNLGSGGSVFIRSDALTVDASTINADNYGSGIGGQLVLRGYDQVAFTNGAYVHAIARGTGSGTGVMISTAASGTIFANASTVLTDTSGAGNGGALSVDTGRLTVTNGANLLALSSGPAAGGAIDVKVGGPLTVDSGAALGTVAFGAGNAGNVSVTAAGAVAIDMKVGADTSFAGLNGIGSVTNDTGRAGNVSVAAGTMTITNAATIASLTNAAGDSGDVSVKVAGMLSIDGRNAARGFGTGIVADTEPGSSGNGGKVIVTAGTSSIVSGGVITSSTFGLGRGGSVFVTIDGQLTIDAQSASAFTGIGAQANPGSVGNAGPVQVNAGSLSIANAGKISASTFGLGAGGDVTVQVGRMLSISGDGSPATDDSTATGILASTHLLGRNAGNVTVTAGSLSMINGGEISTSTFGLGSAGNVQINVAGDLQASNGTSSQVTGILASTLGFGNAGQVSVAVGGELSLDGGNMGIAAIAADSLAATGNGGGVTVKAGALSMISGGEISTNAGFGSGGAGNVFVDVRGQLTIDGGAKGIAVISAASALNSGNSGNVRVQAAGLDVVDGGQISTSTINGAGNAGDVSVDVTGRLLINRGLISSLSTGGNGSGNAGNIAVRAGELEIANGADISVNTFSTGRGGTIEVSAGTLAVSGNGAIVSNTFGPGRAGSVSVTVDNQLTITGTPRGGFTGIASNAERGQTGDAGEVNVRVGTLTVANNGEIASGTFGSGKGGNVIVGVTGHLTIDGTSANTNSLTGINAQANSGSTGNAGQVVVSAGSLLIASNGAIVSNTFGSGRGGAVSVTVDNQLTIAGTPRGGFTGIGSNAESGKTGDAGEVSVRAGNLNIVSNGEISSGTFGSGNGGSVSVIGSNELIIDATSANADFVTGIEAQANVDSTGKAGEMRVGAGSLAIINGGVISATTSGLGLGGDVMVNVAGDLVIKGIANPSLTTGVTARTFNPNGGNAGRVSVSAGNISILNSGIISTSTYGRGEAGAVAVIADGALVIDSAGAPGFATGIASSANDGTGDAGRVSVAAGSISITGGGEIQTLTRTSGTGGDVAVSALGNVLINGAGGLLPTGIVSTAELGSTGRAGTVALSGENIAVSGGGIVSSGTAGAGHGGTVEVTARGPLSLTDPGSGIVALAMPTASGDAGSVAVAAPQITLTTGAELSSTTAGTGRGGSVDVTTPGALVLNGAGVANTQIAASAIGPQSGPGGSVTVSAGSLTINGGAQIASTTAGPGKGGDIGVSVADGVTLSGSGPKGASGISAAALPDSSGAAGEVVLMAGGAIALLGSAEVSSSTAGPGRGGSVRVTAGGPLNLTDPKSRIIASATSSASGDAGSVIAVGPQITIASGAEIASTTAGTGAGGSVVVTTPGALMLDGTGIADTRIAASAIGPQSGPAGTVTVNAGSLTITGGAQIASSTAGLGTGGDVTVTVASDIMLSDPGPQITALSTGSGDAGSITVRATRLLMNNIAAISTEAVGERSAANGGNITLHVRDFLHLVSSEISTSVKGFTGNGGNIAIDPLLVILEHSIIKADAIAGHGGNITITADQFIQSSDSSVEATSQLGTSGTVTLNGLVNANGALAVLSTQLRGRIDILREACVSRAGQPLSTLVEAGRGGLPQDPEATLPALYIAGRDLSPNAETTAEAVEPRGTPLHTTARLTMRCS